MGCLKHVGDENSWKWFEMVRLKFSQFWKGNSSEPNKAPFLGYPNVHFPDLLPCLFSPNNPQAQHFSECIKTAEFTWKPWRISAFLLRMMDFCSYLGMGEVFVLRCILNPAKNFALLRKRIHIRIVQPKKKGTFEDNDCSFLFAFWISFCFIEGYPKTRWWFQTNVFNFHPGGKGNPIWRTRICFKWVGEKPPTR